MFDYYRLLGLHRKAGADEIASAFRARAQVCHPDRLHGAPEAVSRAGSELMVLLNEARAVLSDPVRRAMHDGPTDATVGIPQPASGPEPDYVALRVSPNRVVAHDITPGRIVQANLTFESPIAQFATPTIEGADAGLAVGCEVLERLGRKVRIRMHLDTGLLADNRTYNLELLVQWGNAVGVLEVEVSTAELAPYQDESDRARRRHPSHRPAVVSPDRRKHRLAQWSVFGLIVPVIAIAWSRNHLFIGPPAYGLWVQVGSLALLGAGAYPLFDSRAFARAVRVQGVPAKLGWVVLHLGGAVIWVVRLLWGLRRSNRPSVRRLTAVRYFSARR